MRNPLLKVVLGLLILIVVVLIAIPFFVNGAALRPTLENRLSASLNRKVTIGSLSFSLLSGSLVAKDIAIADDPAFSTSPFLKAQELRVGVEVAPLLFHRDVRITRLNLDSPAIQLIQNQAGKWNYSSLGNTTPRNPQQQKTSSAPQLSVGELQIKDGSATVSSVPPTSRPFLYTNVNLDVKQFSFATAFPFDLSATLPANGHLKLNGTAGPISQQDAAATPVRATLQINHLDPVAAGLLDRSKGISGVLDIAAQIDSTGSALANQGKITASNLQLSRAGSPAPQPVVIDYNVTTDLNARNGRVNDIAVHAGSASAHVNGTYRLTPQAVLLDLHLSAPGLPIDQVEQLLPAVGIKLPAGSQLRGGNLTANLAITGPAAETTIAGPVEIENTKLAGFDLGSRIQGLTALTGTTGGTDIQKLSANIKSSPQTTEISNIDANVPQIGTARGSGTVSPSGALDFKIEATLNNKNVVGAAANQAINQVTGMLGGFLHGGSKPAASTTPHGIPLTITGTTTNPTIRANIAGLLK